MSVFTAGLFGRCGGNVLRWCRLSRFRNAEGEEYLRQRRLQLPFNLTTGEAILYDVGPTVDISQFQFNKMFANGDLAKNVTPGSLLDSFLKQDETAYASSADLLPVDQVFMNSRALVSIPSDTWSEKRSAPVVGAVKEEAKQSMMSVMDNLETGDFCSILENLDVDDLELRKWEDALSCLSQGEDQCSGVGSQLESILANDIFDYIDSILFTENGENLNGAPPSCFPAVPHQQEPFNPTASGLCEPPLFPTPRPECSYSAAAESAQTFNNTRKLSHLPAAPDAPPAFQPCGRMRPGRPPDLPQAAQILMRPHTGPRPNGELPQRAAGQRLLDVLSPLGPRGDFGSAALNVPFSFPSARLENAPPQQVQGWQPGQRHAPQAAVRHNGHEQLPARHGLMAENSSLWQNNVPKLTPGQQGGLACSRAATQSSCMFDQRVSCSPAGGDVTALSGPSLLRWADVYMDQSPPQGSCYFQWSHGEPVVGTSAISQEEVSVSPLSRPSAAPSAERAFDVQRYLDCHRQKLASDCSLQNNYKMNVKGANE